MRRIGALYWICFAGAWALFGAFQAPALHVAQHEPWPIAIVITFFSIVPGAGFGIVISKLNYRFDSRGTWRRLIFFHSGLSIAYSAAWFSAMMLPLVIQKGLLYTWRYSEPFRFWQFQIGFVIYGIIASVCHAVRNFRLLREEERRTRDTEMLRVRAELESLRAKLQPHFLFNTLHTVTALVRTSPAKAEEALLMLGDLLRYVLQAKSPQTTDDVPLEEEWKFVQGYLALEKIRLGDRLSVEATVTREAQSCSVPIFSLQPLVENAIQHAIAPRVRGGNLKIRAWVEAFNLKIEVSDDGPGADLDKVMESPGFGLRVVKQRLETRYPGVSEFRVETRPGSGFRVTLILPAIEADV